MTPELHEACAYSSHVITTGGVILGRGRASMFILHHLGWRWAAVLSVPPLIWPVELGYAIFARNRSFFFALFAREPFRSFFSRL